MAEIDNKAPDEPVWLTYQQAADRLGLPTAAAARAKARRAGWPKRSWGNAGEVAIGVPPSLLVARTPPAAEPPAPVPVAQPQPDTAAVDALRAELAAVRADLAREVTDRRTLQRQADALRERLAGVEVAAAEANATARAERDRRQAAEAARDDAQARLDKALEAARRPWWRRIL